MRKQNLFAMLGLAALSSCAVPPAIPPAATAEAAAAPEDERAILQIEQDWCEAFRTGNAEAIASIEDEAYTLTNSHAELSTREDDLVEVKTHAVEYSSFYKHDQKVRLYGDTAIVSGITSLEGVSGDKPFTLEVRFTDIFVRRNGAWKAVAGHITRLDG